MLSNMFTALSLGTNLIHDDFTDVLFSVKSGFILEDASFHEIRGFS